MKKLYFALIALVAVMMTSCGIIGGDKPTTYTSDQLMGTWEGPSLVAGANESEHLVYAFLKEKATDGNDYWGYTYDEGDDVSYEDLEYHGNGWFTWKISGKNLVTSNYMDIAGERVTPKTYTIESVSTNTLVMKMGSTKLTLSKK